MILEAKFDISSEEARTLENLSYWLNRAQQQGLVVTVERVALTPLAMGHAVSVAHVRRARETAQ